MLFEGFLKMPKTKRLQIQDGRHLEIMT